MNPRLRRAASAVMALALAAPTLMGCSSSSASPAPGFSATGAMSVQRMGHTASLLPDGRVLIAGGSRTALETLATAELYDPAAGTFTATGSMAAERAGATATVLPDGRVLIAGGYAVGDAGAPISLASAEIYDPKGGMFIAAGSLETARYNHTANLLPDGRVLVAGGTGSGLILSSGELYVADTQAGKFVQTGTLKTPRTGHLAVSLADGRVLLVGGAASQSDSTTYLAWAELYDPANGTFEETASMAEARYTPTGAMLADGRVLVCGGLRLGDGVGKYSLSSAEAYDPETAAFTAAGSMANPRSGPATAPLPDGRVLFAGGMLMSGDPTPTYLATAEVYRPSDGSFGFAGTMSESRFGATATALKDGRVLIVGGGGSYGILASALVYQP